MSVSSIFDENFSPHEWGSEPPQVPDTLDSETCASAFASPFEPYVIQDEISSGIHGKAALTLQGQPSPTKRTFLRLADAGQPGTPKNPPGCIHYSIEWTAIIDNKMHWTDTDRDANLAPGAYFQSILQPKLDDVLHRRRSGSGSVIPVHTDVTISVTKRGERPYKARFENLEIQWSIVENQILTWAELFADQKLLVILLFTYEDPSQQSRASWSKRGDKRGATSSTKSMLTDLDLQVDAEQVSGESADWRHVYRVMRCPGPPCDLGPHCWVDPVGRKHSKMSTHQLKRLVRYYQQGGTLETQDDVPEYIREQLIAEEQQRLQRKRKHRDVSPPRLPPIIITNLLPGNAPHGSQPVSHSETTSSNQPPRSITASPVDFDLPGYCDDLVRDYADYQVSKVRDASCKLQVRLVRDAVLAEGFDLRQLYAERDFMNAFLKQNGAKMKGVRERFLNEIPVWVKRRKRELA